MKRPLIIAHRGASGAAPENTLTAFQMAIDLGAEMVEMDLHQSRDGHLVVIHDDKLRRTTGEPGNVSSKTLDELKRLDAGGWKSTRYSGERIPTLQEVFAWTRGKVRLDLEIKEGDAMSSADLVDRLITDIGQANMTDQVLVSSFEWEILRRLREKNASLVIGLLCRKWEGSLEAAVRIQASAVIFSHRISRPEWIREAQSEGLAYYAYTVNEREEMIPWIEAGIDGLCTDYPDRLNNLLREIRPL